MEQCPKCKRMSAEKNHNTGKLICYWKTCLWVEGCDVNARLLWEVTGIEIQDGAIQEGKE